jgi:hypothetical protein
MPFGAFTPLIASLALGFVKGLTEDKVSRFNPEMDFIGPVKEELIYRGLPLWVKPNLPFGSTAAVFAIDHIAHDMTRAGREGTMMQPLEIAARFGDVLLGGMLYESSFRSFGILGAIASHVSHNVACGLGSRARHRR